MKKKVLLIFVSLIAVSLFVKAEDNVLKTSAIPQAYRIPSLALGLSAAYPGVGQFYNGQIGKGIVMTTVATGSLTVMVTGFIATGLAGGGVITDTGTKDLAQLYQVCIPVYLGVWIWSMIDAPIAAQAINQRNAGLLSWKVSNSNTLSLNPDVLYKDSFHGTQDYRQPIYGLSLKLNF
jgi:TM2 domain-containing membrane protein YozV